MAGPRLNKTDIRKIDQLVTKYQEENGRVSLFLSQLLSALNESKDLEKYIHSMKTRLKNPEHLRDKLCRKLLKCRTEGNDFDVTRDNLFVKINDLAGVRILHLYTRQIREIDSVLRSIFDEQRYALIEGPFARTWDDESRAFFESCNIEAQDSPSLYTSVHYVVNSASRTPVTCEIQVRTLMEEVWGEVDHSMNYPHSVDSLACREQLKVLARVTSSATRLVDSIYLTLQEHQETLAIAEQQVSRDNLVKKKRPATSKKKKVSKLRSK